MSAEDKNFVKRNRKDFKGQSKNWTFTDYTLRDHEMFFTEHEDKIAFIAFGEEICPTTGRTHFQGWVQFIKKQRITAVKKMFYPNHVEPMWASEVKNNKYCAKDGKFKHLGSYTVQGERTDLTHVINIMKDGATLKEIREQFPDTYCAYRNGLKDIYSDIEQDRSIKWRTLDIEVLYGPTGTGKTRTAMESDDQKNIYKINGDDIDSWWDGYTGQKTIIIDEYDSQIKLTKLLGLLDGYQRRLPIKGGFTWAQYTKVFITSNISPLEWHINAKNEHIKALYRRINKVTLLKKTGPVDQTDLYKNYIESNFDRNKKF